MTNKYMYFIANWKMFGDLRTLNLLDSVIKFSNSNKKRKQKTNQVLARQINNGLKSIKNRSNIIVAYEPVWSIGTGLIPKSDNLSKSISFIKNKFGKKSPKILYGGSVNGNNIAQLKDINSLDGFLVGGASQNSKKFIDIIKKTFN